MCPTKRENDTLHKPKQNIMKTLHAYVTRIDDNTIQYSNSHPSGSATSKFWCEDFTSTPNLSDATEATYDDIERLIDHECITDVVLNYCH